MKVREIDCRLRGVQHWWSAAV